MRSNEKLVVRAQIGSSPPRCDRKCSTCGESGVHCKAVQVPIGPQHKTLGTIHYFSKSALFTSSEYTYDYKPMTWKCKCGNMIYNP
ncbi:hypothetical protein GIB67_037100 [Kingdonia uniflora]|uniref:Epidermal patterning factor-like protein n=1 Tax=Kingdonia uniflora TaxID=39325 RepID=A0A7J7LHW8_9MAGN|nr:hypothetical protein GIB67_037100 [Kingdonia uniflora]